ncbi:hypothetical protein G7050_02630 [Dysgonomonas sp. HDW5A]|uniref:hypothetical protein n=1 Tax=Dysgonomonas sp. HDW5A TaxID=2714926 RepID=UPI001409F8AE|nr:hypothetical protein [Dysgonomonas sp. HDW5A]QIK58795.1 hypothetical protein G7050_02630 [Dysgonomonas sp. HDW5A]
MIKKKIYLLVWFSTSFLTVHAQIGVNTDYPKGLLHIDAKSDNGTVEAPMTISDDIVFDRNGNMGVGNIIPISKVDIKGTLRINDGSQRVNYGLKSDSIGVASWQPISIAARIDIANLGTGIISRRINSFPSSQDTYYPTRGYITVLPGKSIIRASFGNRLSEPLNNNALLQIRYTLSKNSRIFIKADFLNYAKMGYITLTGLFPQTLMTGSGYWLVENKTGADQKLYLFYSVVYSNIVSSTVNLLDIGSPNIPETMIAISLITG